MDILETGTKKNGAHYEVPLPFRNIGIQPPNNRNQAVKRMHHLQRRFIKDRQFFEEYKRQMANGKELVSKCYAKKTNIKPDNDKLWSLLSVPDLTNQLIGILMRFRTEEVAFMGDIGAMFYQVRVPDSQRSFFRYLWWNNNDLNGELVDYEVRVHVFGGTSSLGCYNYALRRTAVNNTTKYDTEAAETLLHNFYDDLLKSVESEKIAIQLIKDVSKMCREGGFNQTKFICNKKAVLQSVPECHRRSGVKVYQRKEFWESIGI